MKKGLTIAVSVMAALSLAACGSSSAKSSGASSASSAKTTSHKTKHHKKAADKKKAAKSSSSSAASASSNQGQQAQTATSQQGGQVDKSDPTTWANYPYKGYPSYYAYLQANGGDPEVQAETARMQHDWNLKHGIENPDGSETENFKNWVAQRDQAWANGDYSTSNYDQNVQYSAPTDSGQ